MGVGLVNQPNMFAGIDNTVKLPSFTRVDVATFITLSESVRLQANLENLLDRTYFPTANGNNNITPGSPRSARLGVVYRF